MPRSRGLEVSQRQSPRATMQVRTLSSDSDQSHHRALTDRSPKLGAPRSIQSNSLNQKKLGTRIADLESQLGQAQEELKILKDQLVSAETAKQEAQKELEKKSKNPTDPDLVESHEECPQQEIQESNSKTSDEVVDEKGTVESDAEPKDQPDKVTKSIEISSAEAVVVLEQEKPSLEDLAMQKDEINSLKAKLEEKGKALELFGQENEDLRKHLEEARSDLSSAKNKEAEMASRMKQLGGELEASKTNAGQLKETITTLEGAKEALEAEMKKLRVQTEQWRKAADAAAAILAGGVDMNGRCGSMDKHLGGVFSTPSEGYNGFVGSPGMTEDSDYGFGSVKRKGSGLRMFGDLWKKKTQK